MMVEEWGKQHAGCCKCNRCPPTPLSSLAARARQWDWRKNFSKPFPSVQHGLNSACAFSPVPLASILIVRLLVLVFRVIVSFISSASEKSS